MLLSQQNVYKQMLDTIIASFITILSFSKMVHRCNASCIQHSSTAAVQNSQLPFS